MMKIKKQSTDPLSVKHKIVKISWMPEYYTHLLLDWLISHFCFHSTLEISTMLFHIMFFLLLHRVSPESLWVGHCFINNYTIIFLDFTLFYPSISKDQSETDNLLLLFSDLLLYFSPAEVLARSPGRAKMMLSGRGT